MSQEPNFGSADLVKNFIIDLNFTQEEKKVMLPEPVFIALYVILLVILETIGNFLLLCIILHEKYGMDAKKRTVTNQLLSGMIIVQISFNIFIAPIYVTYKIFALQSK